MIAGPRKATDAQLNEAYARLGSVWAVGKEVGMCGQSVHERLQKLGTVTPMNVFTDAELKRLEREYLLYANAGKLGDLAKQMGRTKQFICRQARTIGLTDKNRPRPYFGVWKYISDDAAEKLWTQFKDSRLGLGQFCKKFAYDDLGFARAMRGRYADEWDHVIELKAPKQTFYRLGRSFEYRVRDTFKKAGFFVIRSPQSRSPIDLVAIASGYVFFIQCKRGGSIGVAEWNECFHLAKSVGAVPLLAMMDKSAKGSNFFTMDAPKDGSRKRQPMTEFKIPNVKRGTAW